MIAIVDYGLGNIEAFSNIYNRLNIKKKVAKKADDLFDAEKIILPGVGAFDHAIQLLNASGMRETLEKLVLVEKVPVLGVCVGMQIMASSSDEGEEEGLGWIPGKVKKFDQLKMASYQPLPHMGWNKVEQVVDNALFSELPQESEFYFLHSYHFICDSNNNVLAKAEYGEKFDCIINSQHIYGIQCHPEKSHFAGERILKNFAEI